MGSTRGARTFGHVLANTAVANLTTSFLWFALTFWVYVETRSVLATGLIGGAYMLLIALSGIFFGALVDRHRKRVILLLSGSVTLAAFAVAGVIYLVLPTAALLDLSAPWFWIFATVILLGAVVEQMRNIALSTLVTMLVPDEQRARANGLVGAVQGIAFIATSVLSGLAIGWLGMGWTVLIAVVLVAVTLAHLAAIRLDGDQAAADPEVGAGIDLRGAWRAVRSIRGLFALIIFSTFNNFVGGVYMALMDPYGLELFSVQMWGIWFGVAASGFVIGGLAVAQFGLGANPMRTLLGLCAVMGLIGAVFTLREWAWLYVVGIWAYLTLVPAVEAAEQTAIQRVVPLPQQGRVFGFAMTFESAAVPMTAFVIAPIAEAIIIPWSRGPAGRAALDPLLGQGEARGIALIFLVAGLVTTAAALAAFLTPQYRQISRSYAAAAPTDMEPPG